MASAAEERALALIAKAEKKLNGMFSFGNGKYEEAAEMYGQAAKQYQLGKQCESRPPFPPEQLGSPRNRLTSRCGAVEKSAGCYELVVETHSKLGNFLECAMAYKDAGSMFEKADRPNGALPAPSLLSLLSSGLTGWGAVPQSAAGASTRPRGSTPRRAGCRSARSWRSGARRSSRRRRSST